MSMPPPEEPLAAGPPSRRPGMSTGAKVLIALGIVFGCLMLLCCGGVIALVYYMKKSVHEDPATIVSISNTITGIKIPDELEPTVSVDVRIPFIDQRVMVIAVYQDQQTNSGVVLVGMGEGFGSQSQDEMRRSIDGQLRQQGIADQESIDIEQSYRKEIEIRGEKSTFTIAKGTGTRSQKQRIQVTGSFRGKSGPAVLIADFDAEKFPEQRVVEMLESIN